MDVESRDDDELIEPAENVGLCAGDMSLSLEASRARGEPQAWTIERHGLAHSEHALQRRHRQYQRWLVLLTGLAAGSNTRSELVNIDCKCVQAHIYHQDVKVPTYIWFKSQRPTRLCIFGVANDCKDLSS